MGWRGLFAIAALLMTGVVSGFAAAASLQSDPDTTAVPQPVIAQDPSVPTLPPSTVKRDPAVPALETGLAMRDVTVGTGKNEFVFPAPVGWTRLEPSSNEVKYKQKHNPNNTFVLRVEQVTSQHETIRDIVKSTYDSLKRDYKDFHKIRRTYDSLEFSYTYKGFRRFGFITWLEISHSGQAEAEIALTGREIDVTGMRELINKVIRGIRSG